MSDGEVTTTQNFESDMWDDFASNVPDERPGGDFAELPKDTWVAAMTATSENGKAAPELRSQEIKRGENAGKTIAKFSVGLLTVGGEAGKILVEKHRNKICYMDAFLLPGPKEDQTKPVSGRFTALLNALFSPGIGEELKKDDPRRTAARWTNTVKVLREAQQRFPDCKPENYQGETLAERKAKTIAGVAVALLEEQSRGLLFKTKENSYTPAGSNEKKTNIQVGTFEDDTPKNREKRRVLGFPSDLTF